MHSGMHQGAKDGGGGGGGIFALRGTAGCPFCSMRGGGCSPRVPFKGGGGEGVLVSHKLARSWGGVGEGGGG
jgi:hypothetical protein